MISSNTDIIRVPWKTADEWITVSKWLQDGNKVDAINTLKVWRKREKLSSQIDTTLSILEAEQLTLPENVMSHIYASIIIRFVNGVTSKSLESTKSIASIAKGIGLPLSIVDIRHESTHMDMPYFHRLKECINVIYQWVLDNYWKNREDKITIKASDSEKERSIVVIFERTKPKVVSRLNDLISKLIAAKYKTVSIDKIGQKNTPIDKSYSLRLLYKITEKSEQNKERPNKRVIYYPSELSLPEFQESILVQLRKKYSVQRLDIMITSLINIVLEFKIPQSCSALGWLGYIIMLDGMEVGSQSFYSRHIIKLLQETAGLEFSTHPPRIEVLDLCKKVNSLAFLLLSKNYYDEVGRKIIKAIILE